MNDTPTPRTDHAAYYMGRTGENKDNERWCDLLNESRKLERENAILRQDLDRRKARDVASLGESNGQAKLTEDDVRAIRARYIYYSRDHGTYAMARDYGVTNQTILKIVARKLWGHVK
jgi:hypothetical protein